MDPMVAPARQLWEAIEPIHATVYFAPQSAEAMKQLGLRGWWMGYFAGRFAPLGPIGPEPATAMAFGFAPWMVARALPDAWTLASPEPVVAARIAAATAALAAALPPSSEQAVRELTELLGRAVTGCRYEGRPLAAGWLGLRLPDDVLGRLWVLTTILREHRGDGHVVAAVDQGLRGLDTTVTLVATGAIARDTVQPNRGWSDDEWEESVQRLRGQGLLDGDGRLTDAGWSLRRALEETTDRLAADPVERLGNADVDRAIELSRPLSRHLVDTGTIPVPNPIGAPRP